MSAPGAWRVHLSLGRVSNLPTVWSNVIAAYVLSGAALRIGELAATAASLSAFYVGGMYLNDAFDRAFDARERPERPIPAGWITARRVFVIGFALLALGVGSVAFASGTALLGALPLTAAIVAYDAWHKGHPLSTLVMGLCRALVYVTAALAAGGAVDATLVGGAAALFAYVVGLSYVARQETLARVENLWPLALVAAPALFALYAGGLRLATLAALAAFVALVAWATRLLQTRRRGAIPIAVGNLIAGIALADALACASHGASVAALGCGGAFVATRILHRWVAGT
jgi:hypothetical protein